MSTHEAVIVSCARTPIGTANKGSLRDVDALMLASKAVQEAVRRSGIDPTLVDDVILGESIYGGGDIARYAAVEAGLINAPGIALNRHCASGLSAVHSAASSIRSGMDRVVVAGGAQSASTAPRFTHRVLGTDEWEDWFPPSHRETPDAPTMDMSITVGWNAAYKAGLTREDMDAWALRSHQRAVRSIDAGSFDEEIFAIDATARDGSPFSFSVDEQPRRDTTMERLASLKPIHPEIEGFSITAGNAAGVNDGAAAMVLCDRALSEQLSLEPLAVVRSWASAGVTPADTGLAPPFAVRRALERAGLAVGDIALWEINEAFASVAVAATRELGIDEELVNVQGSGCSLGHPIAMTGARMVMSMIYELRRRGGGTGVATMCAGGGMATALVLDVPAPAQPIRPVGGVSR